MKIKILQDLSDNFEVLSRSEEKETLGGALLTSTTDGYVYDINTLAGTMGHINYIPNTNNAFLDTDQNNFGMSFSYTVIDDGYGSPTTINVNEGQWDKDRFSLLYIDLNNGNAFGDRVYLDNITGYTFNCNGEFLTNLLPGSGYEYESLPDVVVSDNDLGIYSGYTRFQCRLESYVVYDELLGGYNDYSRILTTATHYNTDYEAMWHDGYQQENINRQIAIDNSRAGMAKNISNIVNYINGSKLAAAQKAFAADPNNHNQQFDYAAYNRSNLPVESQTPKTPMITIVDDWGEGSRSVKDYYEWFRNEVETHGLENIYSSIFNP